MSSTAEVKVAFHQKITDGLGDIPRIGVVNVDGEKSVRVEWFGQGTDIPTDQRFAFPLNVPRMDLSTPIDEYYVTFLGTPEELIDLAETDVWKTHHPTTMLHQITGVQPDQLVAVVSNPVRWNLEDFNCVRYPGVVSCVEVPNIRLVTPRPFYNPDLQRRIDTSSTFDQRFNFWLNSGQVR